MWKVEHPRVTGSGAVPGSVVATDGRRAKRTMAYGHRRTWRSDVEKTVGDRGGRLARVLTRDQERSLAQQTRTTMAVH
jgi:hypothetical protein